MDEIKKLLDKLFVSKEYKEFLNEHDKAYFTSAFVMVSPKEIRKWTLDFFCPAEQRITSFLVEKDIKSFPSQQVMQKEQKDPQRLKIEDVKIPFKKAYKIAREFQKEKYPGEDPNKLIIVLQVIKETITWNISFLTAGFKLLNMKIDAVNGNIIDSSIENLLKMHS